MRATIRAAVVIPLLTVALLAGCGDDQVKADNAYVGATNRAVRAFETQFQQLQTSFTPASTTAQDQRTLATLRAAVGRVAEQLRRIQAPPRIATLHARLIAQVQGYDGAIATAGKAFAARDPRKVIAARARFSTMLAAVATQITATINLINGRLQ